MMPALLAGVTATDAEDGDVTASLLVEGISGRNDDGTVQVTYAAFDSNHHVTKATRAVRYTDYTKRASRSRSRWSAARAATASCRAMSPRTTALTATSPAASRSR